MKVVSYNILRGGQLEAGNRIGQIVDFLAAQNPTICGLFECDNFEANEGKIAHIFEQELDMKIVLHRSRSKSNIGLLYDPKVMTLIQALTFDRFMYHGLLAADFEFQGIPLRFVLVHLNPYSAELRLIESQILTQIAVRAENTLIMGDFNCPPPGSQLEMEKFKATFRARVTNEKSVLDTRSIEHILANGFDDLWNGQHPGDSEPGSYPTPLAGKDQFYPETVRIDYFFGSPLFKKSCTTCEVIRNEVLDHTSDHYPITSTFEFEYQED
jgi:endonuclease/exonuclease/phosphatase family metal-dependent hydrolase